MNKEIIICLIIIILVVVFNIITTNYTKEVVETINISLRDFKEELLVDNVEKEELKNTIDSILKKWNEKNEILAYYIEHDELEKVETELTSLASSIDVEEYDDGIENLDRCIFILNHIKDKYVLEIKNIF